MPHAHEPYPEFSVECVRDIFNLVRAREVRTQFALFCKCLYELIGSALKLTVGEPGGPFVASAEAVAQLEQASVEELQKCCEALQQAEGEVQTFGAGEDDKAAIDPATIAMLIQLAVSLIQAIIERRKPKPQ